MGVDYSWAGSASNNRFKEELISVARILGGTKISDHPLKFSFRKGTDIVIVNWLNNIMSQLSIRDTRKVAREVFKHKNIKYISPQLWYELKMITKWNEWWFIT